LPYEEAAEVEIGIKAKPGRLRKKLGIAAPIIAMAFISAIMALPVIFTVMGSFMSSEEITNRYTSQINEYNKDDFSSHNVHFARFSLLPERFSASQYKRLLLDGPLYLRQFWNSTLLIVPILLGQCILSPLAAYALERIRWKGKEALYFVYIIVMLMPLQLTLVPNFIVAGWLGIRDSYLAVILPLLFHPLGLVLVRQQLKGFPKECLQAAELDGADAFQIYRRIVLPNISSVIAAVMILLFADNWNIVEQAVVFLNDVFRMPLSVYLSVAKTSDPSMYFAVSAFYLIPALLVFLYGQDELAQGISLSSLRA
jgi:multiple sugar transport system permease protein